MKHSELIRQLEQLDTDIWQALLHGKPLALVDDQRLELATESCSNIIILPQQKNDIASLRDSLVSTAEEILNNYYLRNPLSKAGFNRQAGQLVNKYGAVAFAAVYPAISERTLFVELGEVIAETSESPRHRYGAYVELDEPLSEERLGSFVEQWLSSGTAYEQYISMNACRYGCIS